MGKPDAGMSEAHFREFFSASALELLDSRRVKLLGRQSGAFFQLSELEKTWAAEGITFGREIWDDLEEMSDAINIMAFILHFSLFKLSHWAAAGVVPKETGAMLRAVLSGPAGQQVWAGTRPITPREVAACRDSSYLCKITEATMLHERVVPPRSKREEAERASFSFEPLFPEGFEPDPEEFMRNAAGKLVFQLPSR